MKKIILFFLALISFFIAPLTTKTPATQSSKEYNWNYWSYEFGFGAGYIYINEPTLNLPGSSHTQNTEAVSEPSVTQFPFPDFRLGIEKSWRFADKFTATIDFACLTPAATVGYLITPKTRLYIGTQYSLVLNFGNYSTSKTTEERKQLSADGVIETSKIVQSASIHTQGPLLGLTPRVGIDHFISPSTMLRFNISYDWRTFYNKETKQPIPGNLHWPQLTVGLKKFF